MLMDKGKVAMRLELEVLGRATVPRSRQEKITLTVNFKGLASANESKGKEKDRSTRPKFVC